MIFIKSLPCAVLAASILFFPLNHVVFAQETTTGSQLEKQVIATPKVTWSSESSNDDDSYAARNINRRQVHAIDPNIWAYTAEFAERFKMPKEWIASDLQGAEAVAFRIEPTYRTCGWGSNPNACRENETLCVMDVYFDNTKQSLPWERSMRATDLDIRPTSVLFLSFVKPISRPEGRLRTRRPFSELGTGRELWWNVDVYGTPGISGGEALIRAYDKQIFENMSFVQLQTICGEQVRMRLKTVPANNAKEMIYHTVEFPQFWHQRIGDILQENNSKNEAYFKKIFEEMKHQKKQFN